MGNYLIQGRHGRKGNFELVVPPTHGDGPAHYWRNNDAGTLPWSGPASFGRSRIVGAALIQGNFGTPGNLEVVATDQGGNLDAYWRQGVSPFTWSGAFRVCSGVRGTPALVQSRFGTKGNFEVVVPHAQGGLVHVWRNNDNSSYPWSGPGRFGGGALYSGVALIQSNYGGNLEVLAVAEDGGLDFFWRTGSPGFVWSGPHRIGTGYRGSPALVQSNFGRKGNFEVVVPLARGGLAHLWRNNDVGSMPWSGPFAFGGTTRYAQASLVQGNFGGNLEVVAIAEDEALDFFWRTGSPGFAWSGPARIGTELSFRMAECIYGWTSAYVQSDTDVTVRVALNPDAGITAQTLAAARTRWENGIRAQWNDRFDCVGPGGERRAFRMNVQWVTANAHHTVRVVNGPFATNMTNWSINDSGNVAAHEFGHMIGNPDEYASSVCPNRSPVSNGTIMDDNDGTVARLYNRHAGFHGHGVATHSLTDLTDAVLGAELTRSDPMSTVDDLDGPQKGDALQALRRVAETGEPVPDTEISWEIVGGAPGVGSWDRTLVRADGAVKVRRSQDVPGEDGLRAETVQRERRDGQVGPDTVARVFAEVAGAGALDDEAPVLTDEPIVPDSLVGILTVRTDGAVRRIAVPLVAAETATDQERQAWVPLAGREDLLAPAAVAERLAPTLLVLQEVEAATG